MSVSIKYKGTEIASASTETTKTIKTAGKYCEADILVENTPDGGDAPVINPLSITANGTYTAPSGVDGYSPINVNVPQGITPSGSLDITENGTYDVTEYAEAVVDVSGGEGAGGNYNIESVDDGNGGQILNITDAQGGGSLPSVISKIDGGSFTVASDTICNAYDIAHALGEAPKAFVVWTEDEDTYRADVAALIAMVATIQTIQSTATTTIYATSAWRYRAATGSLSNANSDATTEAQVANFATSTTLCAYRAGINYRAGNVYKWLAWA